LVAATGILSQQLASGAGRDELTGAKHIAVAYSVGKKRALDEHGAQQEG
jgi:hypothetical protein